MEREKLTYEQRKEMYIDAVTFNNPRRVMLNAFQMGWMYADCGMTLDVASRDYYMSEVAIDTFMQKYPVDAMGSATNGFRYHYRFTDPLGTGSGYADNDGLKRGHVNAVFENLITADDYKDMMNDLDKVRWEKAFFNLYPNAKDMDPEAIARASQEVFFLMQAKEKVNNKMRDKWGILIPYSDSFLFMPFVEDLFNIYRGIKGLAMDLRRRREEVYEVCEYFDEKNLNTLLPKIEAMPDGYGVGIRNYFDGSTGALSHTMINDKHLERLFIAPMKKFLDVVQKKNKTLYATVEGSFLNRPIGDMFGECKKGTFMMTVEMDDPYEVRKAYPNLGIMGGLDVNILGNGTPEESVEMAKRAIEGLGKDGGLWLAPNKMVAYRYDMKSENIKAVAEYVSQL